VNKKIYLIIGEKNSGKSSIIRALTGIRISGKINIAIPTEVTFYVQLMSFQEEAMQNPSNAIKSLKKINCESNLCALRLNKTQNFPDAQTYIDALINEGWEIAGIIVLGENNLQQQFHQLCVHTINPPKEYSINKNASKIRKWWSWL
jgi:energy-coupling factor transporter ATP-binding protein EcfA2